jgi:hypothetical protein
MEGQTRDKKHQLNEKSHTDDQKQAECDAFPENRGNSK